MSTNEEFSNLNGKQADCDPSGTTVTAKNGLDLDAWTGFEYSPMERADVLSMNLSEQFSHVFGLLYAVFKSSERSERSLALTTRAINLNQGNPTAWMLRRESAIALATAGKRSVWTKELSFTASVIAKNAKTYQAWEHRRFAAETGDLLRAEIDFVDVVLAEDAKNYHAWSLRSWLVLKHGIVEGELDATEWFIRADIRNNSAWNHRWVVTGVLEGKRNEAELKMALDVMYEAPRNESVWNYIHALGKSGVDTDAAVAAAEVCLEGDAGCVPARRFLILNGDVDDAKDVMRHCEVLSSGVDSVRKKYWDTQREAARKVAER